MEQAINIRALALETLLDIRKNGKQSHRAIGAMLEKYQYLPRKERAFFMRLCQGTLEYCLQLDYVLDQYSSVKTKKMKPIPREILRMSVYQLLYMDRVPVSAVVNEAVKLTGKKGIRQLKGFVNAVLRKVAAEKDRIPWPADSLKRISVQYAMPEFLVRKWVAAYGEETTEKICGYYLTNPPLSVRIREGEKSREEILTSLQAQGVSVTPNPMLPYAFALEDYDYLEKLPEFREGYLQVQDTSSMLAVEAAGIRENSVVADLCAAPGGKSILAADLMNGTGSVIAGDLTEYKVSLIEENLERCRVSNVTVRVHDAREEDESLLGKADVVIADLPCSGLGVIGKKPDIKYRISEEDIRALVELQRQILTTGIRYLKNGGTLLYSTCTITPEENAEQVQWLLEHFPLHPADLAETLPESAARNMKPEDLKRGYIQLLPGEYGTDGFFFARLIKDA